ncbi:MAG: 50S ribosomal protein L21 [Vicinamibacterales bacterium]
MYAIVQTGGRQVKVTPGDFVTVDRLDQDSGAEVTFDKVLLVATDNGDIVAGNPLVSNARVLGVVDGEARGPKIRVFMKKRRKGSRRTLGHRSRLTRVRIREILV